MTDPNSRTTLVLNNAYLPIFNATAKAAIKQLLRGNCLAITKYGNCVNWQQWINHPDFLEDQPFLKTASKSFPVPTIILTKASFFYKNIHKRNPTKRELIKFFKNTCQICYERFVDKELTIEHFYPKSKGGINCDTNYLITCKKCNNKKGNNFPYFDKHGNLLNKKKYPRTFRPIGECRKEWEPFLLFK